MSKLKLYRLEAGFNQHELAAASDVPRYKIQQCESGFCLPTFEEMEKLAAALGKSTEKIFGGRANSVLGEDEA